MCDCGSLREFVARAPCDDHTSCDKEDYEERNKESAALTETNTILLVLQYYLTEGEEEIIRYCPDSNNS